jgi:SRSO17 transposase
MGYRPGIGVIDESGFVKQGQCSAGVKRQYCGRVGQIENCQVGVYLGDIAPTGHALIDRELYLPQDWCDDPVGRVKAKIPEDIQFATKPQLAQHMLERAWAEGLAMQSVVGDSTDGNSPTLREAIATTDHGYVLEIPQSAPVRVARPSAPTVESLVASVAADQWRRYALNLSEPGLGWSDWTARRVVSTSDTLGQQWLVVRRTVTEPPDTTYFLSNADSTTSLDLLAQVGGSPYPVEHLLEEAKGSAGLGQYQVRYWHSWYRHMTLALMVHTWLTLLRQADAQKKVPAHCPSGLF